MIMKKLLKHISFASIVMLSGMGTSNASLLQLSHEPLFLNQTVPPAIVVTLDDSGSMQEAYMGSSGNYSFADPRLNRLYYNPNITYAPPLKADGSPFPDSDPKDAWVDGYPNDMTAKIDLTDHYIAMDEIRYSQTGNNVTIDFRDTARYNARNGEFTNYYPTGCDNGCTGGTKPYYFIGTTRYDITDAEELKNFANWYSYYNSRMKLARAAISRAFVSFSPSIKIAWQELNRTPSFNVLQKFENVHRGQFFDWLFGVPTSGGTPLRASFQRAGDLFELDTSYLSTDFAGLLSCQQNFHIAISDGGWNGSLSGTYLQDDTGRAIPGDTGTPENNNQPLYGAMAYTGTGYQRVYNYSRDNWLADVAFDSWMRDLKPNLPNYVPRYKADYTASDGSQITFTSPEEWENAEFVWNPKNDPAYWQHVVTYNVGMGLNASLVENHARGNYGTCPNNGITDSKESVLASLRSGAGSCVWPNNVIDDVWHSSINSRGDFFSASDPDELITALTDVVENISERTSRGSSSTVTSGVVTDESEAYSPTFDSSTWSGSLIAKEVNADRTFGDVTWDAACVLTGGLCESTGENVPQQTNRKIYTFDPVNDAKVEFDTNMPDHLKTRMFLAAQNYVNTLFGGGLDALDMNKVINYTRGDRTDEQSNGGVFRDRKTLMADIIHSSPVIIRGPSEFYEDSFWSDTSVEKDNPYLDFKIQEKDRKNVVYIGSNGGMLHAFETDPSSPTLPQQELWSYVPSKALFNLPHLPSNKHHSYVDNKPVKRDVFINGQWRTVLIGGMRYGGQSYYALDVTDGSASEPTVLWEFNDWDDADLGYTYGQAEIVRLGSTGEWVALLPNGYNNSEPDTLNTTSPFNHVSLSGTALLYVVRISDGQVLAKIDTGVGDPLTPNGLSTPTGVDSEFWLDGDTLKTDGTAVDHGVESAYAGDLYGNLWRFDFRDSDPSNWTVENVVKATGVMDRPITVKPRVLPVPDAHQTTDNDVIVMFATGKYIEVPDRDINLPADQYIVGIFDGLEQPGLAIDILDSNIVEQSFTTGGVFRDLTNNDVDLTNNDGWKIELPEDGERVFNPMSLLGSDVLLLTSNITAGIDPCLPGGRSWLLAVNPLTGGIPLIGGQPTHIFKNIRVIINGQLVPISGSGTGISVNDFIIGEPPVLTNQGGGSGSIVIEGTNYTNVIDIDSYTWRRRNWTNLLTE